VRLLIVLGLALLYLLVVGTFVRMAVTDDFAGYMLLVPVASAIIAWRRRDRFRGIIGPGSPAGLALVGVALILLVYGLMNQSYRVQAFSLVVAIAGAGLWLRGVEWLRQAAFPLGFLLLILPLPSRLIAAVSPPLQHFVAGFTTGALRLLQIPVERKGLLLHLSNATIQIDEGCSGLRFLLVLFVITTGLAHAVLSTPGRRLLVIIGVIPAALLANMMRVTEIAVVAYLLGPQTANGPLHDYIGKGNWLLAIAALLAWTMILRKTAPQPSHGAALAPVTSTGR
jgi:exosortase